jgi:class 3 adenylate cyclase
VEVRDDEGAERCIVSAAREGAGPAELADLLFAATTDHRYLQLGHVADFVNKAHEALDIAGWQHAEAVLASLAHGLATAERMEESNSWRHPVDLIAILDRTQPRLEPALARGLARHGRWTQPRNFVQGFLGDDPEAIVEQLLGALNRGATPVQLAAAVTHAAGLRLLQFHTSNEFSDWDTAFHTYSYAHAIHQGLRRTGSPELFRGVLDAAMSVYLDRFLNVPPARVPQVPPEATPDDLLVELSALLDRQQQIGPVGAAVWHYLQRGGSPESLLFTLGGMLLREDRNFHSIQVLEAAFSEHRLASEPEARAVHITAAVRFLAAHCPTVRSQEQTFQNALRLSRGERLYEETETILATTLFADIVGSTARAAAMGDRRWRRILEQHNTAVRSEVEHHGGRATEFTGDGFMSLFDGPGRAIRCARAIFDQARTLGLDLRAGVHTGECEVDGDGVRGIALHIGARVADQAAAGEIIVSGTVRDLVAGAGFALEDRGQKELRGVPGQWALYRVVI